MHNIFLKSQMVTKVIGILSFIALCAACLANPFAVFAGNDSNSVILIQDYGSIDQLSVMPNGQLAMNLKMNSNLHGVKRALASPSATSNVAACATSKAQKAKDDDDDDDDAKKTPDADDANETPKANTTPSAQAAINGIKAQVASKTPDIPVATNTSSAQENNDAPDADDACENGAAAPNKAAVLSSQIPAGHILAVQLGSNQVVCISLAKSQCLMPDGQIMKLRS